MAENKGCLGCLLLLFFALLSWAMVIGGAIAIIYAIKS